MAPKIASNFGPQQRLDGDESESSSYTAELTDSDCSPREPRHVRFLVNNDQENAGPVTAILETDPMSEEEARAYYMQPEDFQRCDEDIKRTVRKWLKHVRENEPFDFEYCSVRGAEQLVDHMQRKKGINNDTRSGAEIKLHHVQDVLKEVKFQQSSSRKTHRALYNVDRIRQASLRSAGESVYRAVELAEQDEEDLRKIHPRWSAMHPRGPKRSSLVLIEIQLQAEETKANVTSIQKPLLTSLKSIDFARRRGSMFGSFLQRKK